MKKEIPTKRICETETHEEIELEKFEKCPKCGSEAYHRVVPLPIEDLVKGN